MGAGTQFNFDQNAFGPFGSLFQTYISALENFGRSYGVPSVLSSDLDTQTVSERMRAPLKAAGRSQLEILGLVNRRTQAYLQVPTRLAQCRSPQDLVEEQMAFWRTAGEQYAESSRKLFDAWSFGDAWTFQSEKAAERDYINFNGSGAKDGGTQTTRQEQPTGKQRRVA